ncbi:hypothetical protein ACQKWADRAFT_296473 [Trichoderma austrokoningii]
MSNLNATETNMSNLNTVYTKALGGSTLRKREHLGIYRRTWRLFVFFTIFNYSIIQLLNQRHQCWIHKVKLQLCTSRLSARGWQMTLRLNRNPAEKAWFCSLP